MRPLFDLDRLEPSYYERRHPSGLYGQLQLRRPPDQRVQARLELDARERCADADVDAAAKTDVLGGIRAGDVEDVRSREDAGIAVGRAEEHRDHLAAPDRHTGDLDALLEHPALEELEWGVVADQLFDGGGCRHFADGTPSSRQMSVIEYGWAKS